MRTCRIFTPSNLIVMRAMAEHGCSTREIARFLGSTPASVRVVCSRHKIRVKRERRGSGIRLPAVRAASIHDIVAHMPAPLYVEFHRKAERLQMSPSVLASNLLAAITISNIFEAVLDDED